MKLSNIGFNYVIKNKKFSHIFYKFNILSDAKQREKVIDLAKSSLQDLETILDKNYTGNEFKKEENGKVNSSEIEFGYDYGNLTQLRYVISMNSKGEPRDLTLSLMNIDPNSERLLGVYNLVLAIPNLEISDEAKIQVNRINSLISERFDVKEYLGLPRSD
ncbi:MAG: hypothetical protein NTZ83_01035 [Candidatus Pacearchaeota archaeon]|nr:hypothetical protein [Candidatus Pacearchaeota archaeon]